MKRLEDADANGEPAKEKRVIPDGKNRGVVVLLHGEKITAASYKKKTGWQADGSATHLASTWKGLAEAILELTR